MGVAAASGERIEVDPEVLIRAGGRMGSLGLHLAMLSDALGSALSNGIASGTDPAGLHFGVSYGHQAQAFADMLAAATNSFKAVGYLLDATGYNYRNADAASTIGGPGPTGGVGGEPSTTTAGDAPEGPSSAMVPPPATWFLIQSFLGVLPGLGSVANVAMAWPSGNPAMLRLTAAQWRTLGQGLSAFDQDVAALKAAVSVQQIPEGPQIGAALTGLGDKVSNGGVIALGMAQSIDDFARGVQETQDAIRRLLDGLSFEGVWDTVKGIFTGEGEDLLQEIARDVGAVLGNFQDQVKGVLGLLEELTSVIGEAATEFQKWMRPVLVAQFGDDVGNVLADVVTVYTDFEAGVATGLIGCVSGTVAMADPDTWQGMAEVALSVARDPSTLPGVLADMGKEFVALDKWSGDHPGRAAGEAAFNVGSLFLPGGALSKTGTVARGLRYTSRLLDEGRLPRLTDLPGLGRGNRGQGGLDDLPGTGSRTPPLPEFRPAAIPDSVIGPATPHGVDTPTSPRGIEGPTGPPEPPGPTGSPRVGDQHGAGGGDGPPPDPPGRSTGPSESGPGRVDGPAAQSPASPGPSHVDPLRVSEPAAPSHSPSPEDATPSGAQHPSESSSPASPDGAGQSPSAPAPTPATHESAHTETPDRDATRTPSDAPANATAAPAPAGGPIHPGLGAQHASPAAPQLASATTEPANRSGTAGGQPENGGRTPGEKPAATGPTSAPSAAAPGDRSPAATSAPVEARPRGPARTLDVEPEAAPEPAPAHASAPAPRAADMLTGPAASAPHAQHTPPPAEAPTGSGGPHDPPTPHHPGSGEHPSDDGAPLPGTENDGPDAVPDPDDPPPEVDRPAFTLDDPLSHMSPELRDMSEAHLTDSGETVLGPFRPDNGGPSYIAVAEGRGASFFSLGDAWDDFEPIEQLAANQHVLDMAIGKGDTVRLSTDFDLIPADSYTAAEIRYLEAHGYTREGNILHPPPRGR